MAPVVMNGQSGGCRQVKVKQMPECLQDEPKPPKNNHLNHFKAVLDLIIILITLICLHQQQ